MLTYLINVSIAWIILFVLYKALLEKEKYFTLNRVYLLSSLVLGLLLPLISYISVQETPVLPVITSQINEVYQSQIIAMEAYVSPVTSSTQTTAVTASFNWILMFQLIYFLGLAFALFRLIKSSSKLFRLLTKSQTNKKSSHSEIVVSENILPFSFMKYIFIGNQDYNSNERNNILTHELYHVQSYHSLDIIFVELLKMIFWWHPMVYLYKRSIAENHEYAADEAVLVHSSRKQYCELLMKKTFPNVNLELTNPFFQTFIKKRITMMYQKESSKINLLKYSTALFAVVFIATIFVKPVTAQINNPVKIASVTGLEKYEKKENTLIDIYNTKVTQEGKELELGKDYNMDATTGQLEVTNNEILNNGKPVKVKYVEDIDDEQSAQTVRPQEKANSQYKNITSKPSNIEDCKVSEAGIYYHLEVTSRLPSCPEGENGRWHAYPILEEFAMSHFNWPAKALEEGFTKNVYFNIVVDAKGNLTEILEMHQEPYPFGIQEEFHRIIDLMRDEFKFLPGECNGVPVKTRALFGVKLVIPEDKRHLVKIKNASNMTPKQEVTLGSVSSEGKLNFGYNSNMNVAMSIEVENPDGKVIFTDSRDFIYARYIKTIQLAEKRNGNYKLKVTQDGQVKETSMNVTIFK